MQKKKILITGGAGFIGANFVYKFLELGYDVSVMERKEANLWRLEKAMPDIKIYSPNLLDYKNAEACVSQIAPDIVIHFATYGAYQRIQQDTNLTIDTNLKGTINLINACQKIGVEAFINTGTNSEYGIKEKPMKETDVLEANNLYGITKGAATMYCQMMARNFDFPAVTIRPFAAYGYLEEKSRLAPSIILACLKNKPMELSKPDSVRPFMFIEDVIDAYLLAIKNIDKIKGQIINIGNKKQHTIADMVAIVKKITGSLITPTYGNVTIAQTEPKFWIHDISKAKKILNWKPKHTLKQGMKKDVEWFKRNITLYE